MKYTLSILMLGCLGFVHCQQSFPYFHGPSALARAGIYSPQSGPQAVYCNPAKLSLQKSWAGNLSVQNQYELAELMCYQLAVSYGNGPYGSVGLGIQQFGSSKFRDQKFHLSYARQLGKDLHMGIGFHWWVTNSLYADPKHFFTLDIGMTYRFLDVYEINIHLFNPFVQRYSEERYTATIMTLGITYHLHDHIQLLFEAEKNMYQAMSAKIALQYELLERYQISTGICIMPDGPVVSGGFHYKTKFGLEFDFGLNYHQVLGLSSAVGFDYYLRRDLMNNGRLE